MPPQNEGTLFTPPLKDGKGVKVGVKEAARTLVGFYGRHGRLMSADLACRVARSGLQLVIPMVALKVFQEYLPSSDLSATGWASLVFAVLAVASSAFEWCGTLCGQWLGFRLEAEMREKLFAATNFTPLCSSATGACSREEPQPKYFPAATTAPPAHFS